MDPKVAIVTGSSSGLGRDIPLNYGGLGRKIVCADLRSDNLHTTTSTVDLINKETTGESIFIRTDVSSSDAIQTLVNTATQTFGRLDVLVNNAEISLESHGKLGPKPTADTDDSTFDTTWAVNARSAFLGCKYAIRQFLRQSPRPSGERGWIINIASVNGLESEVEHIIKTEMDRVMLEDETLGPATVALQPWGTLGTIADITKAAIFLANEQSAWITGTRLPVDGGYMVA